MTGQGPGPVLWLPRSAAGPPLRPVVFWTLRCEFRELSDGPGHFMCPTMSTEAVWVRIAVEYKVTDRFLSRRCHKNCVKVVIAWMIQKIVLVNWVTNESGGSARVIDP